MSQGSDLSAYEKLRMENIRKNNEFLAQLGLFPMQKKEITQPNIVQEIREKKKRVKVETDSSIPLEKRRRSGRLSGQFVKDEEIVESQGNIYEEQVGEQEPFYDRIPQVNLIFIQQNTDVSHNYLFLLYRSPTNSMTTNSKHSWNCESGDFSGPENWPLKHTRYSKIEHSVI